MELLKKSSVHWYTGSEAVSCEAGVCTGKKLSLLHKEMKKTPRVMLEDARA